MFTGVVSAVGRVASLRVTPEGGALAVERPAAFSDVAVGESIAVSGVCLTAVSPMGPGQVLLFDVSPETLARSSLGSLQPGAAVNLERALRVSDRLGGHIVAGHVDGTSRVLGIEKAGESWSFRFSLPASLARYAVEKGSISVDGISLTVAALEEGSFEVAVIPHTFLSTTLGTKNVGDLVNLEADVLGKYVERLLSARLRETRETGGTQEARDTQAARDERLRGLLTNGA